MGKQPGAIWRPSKECQTTIDIIRLPLERCLVALHVDQSLDKQALEEELAVLDMPGKSSNEKPWLTWFVPPAEFYQVESELIRQKAAKRARRGEQQRSAFKERYATIL